MRSKIIDIAAELEGNAEIDGESKFAFLAEPHVFRKFRDDFHWLIYDFTEATGELRIINVGSTGERQRLYRPPR